MKICPNCSNTVEDSAVFCDKCGTRFAVQNNTLANYAQQPSNQPNYVQQPQYNYGTNQPQYQNTAPQTPIKKKNTGVIIGIIAAVVILLAIIGSVAEKAFQNQGYGDGDENDYTPPYSFGTSDSSSDAETDIAIDNNVFDVDAYTKGSIVDGWYVNEWANMRFDTNGWINGTEELNEASENDSNTEWGIMLYDEESLKQISIVFEKLHNLDDRLSESDYLSEQLDVATSYFEQLYQSVDLDFDFSDYYDKTIAGEKFKAVKIGFISIDGLSLVEEVCIREHDGYLICVSILAQNSFDANAIANNIRTIK